MFTLAASTWFRIVRHTCRAAGFDPRGLIADDNMAVQAFAAADLGVAVIPGLAIAHALPNVEVRPIRGLAPVRRIWAARPRDPFCPAAARAMIDTVKLTAKPRTAGRSGRAEPRPASARSGPDPGQHLRRDQLNLAPLRAEGPKIHATTPRLGESGQQLSAHRSGSHAHPAAQRRGIMLQ